MELSSEEKGVLIHAARDSIKSLFGENIPGQADYSGYSALNQTGPGAFVTLTMNNQLRGCIGYISSQMTVYDTVCEAAKQAAVNDPRFHSLRKDEFPKVEIEISILSPLSPISDYGEIKIGTHGLVLDEPYNRALLLPQVATENNFDVPRFLTALCEKAGINPYEWEDRMLIIKTFTATVFSETEYRKSTYEHG